MMTDRTMAAPDVGDPRCGPPEVADVPALGAPGSGHGNVREGPCRPGTPGAAPIPGRRSLGMEPHRSIGQQAVEHVNDQLEAVAGAAAAAEAVDGTRLGDHGAGRPARGGGGRDEGGRLLRGRPTSGTRRVGGLAPDPDDLGRVRPRRTLGIHVDVAGPRGRVDPGDGLRRRPLVGYEDRPGEPGPGRGLDRSLGTRALARRPFDPRRRPSGASGHLAEVMA